MFFARAILLLSLSFQPQFSAAHGGGHKHDHHHDHQPLEVAPETIHLSQDNLRELMDQAHEALESEEHGAGFFRRWKDKFNFKQIGMNAYRWYNMNRHHPAVANAGANITVMLLGSHTLETVGGLGMASNSVAAGELGITEMLLTTVGITITVPGLDPLCLILVGAYGKWPDGMNKLLTVPRVFLTKSLNLANSLVGIEKGWWSDQWFGWRRDRFARRLAAGLPMNTMIERVQSRPVYTLFNVNGEELVKLGFEPVNEREMGLSFVELPAYRPGDFKSDLKAAVKPFGWNISNWVNEIFVAAKKGNVAELKHRPFVTEVYASPINGVKISTRPLAFAVAMSCEDALMGIETRKFLKDL